MNTDTLSLLTTGLTPQRASLPGADGAAGDLAGFAALLMGMVPGAVPQAAQAWSPAMTFGQNDASSLAATGESAAPSLGAGFPSLGAPGVSFPGAGFLGSEARGAAPLLPAGMDIVGPKSVDMRAVPFQRAADLLRAPLSAGGMLQPAEPTLSPPSAAIQQLLGQMTPVTAAEPLPIRVTPGQASPLPAPSVGVRPIPAIEGDAVAALVPATSSLATQPLAGASPSATAMPDDMLLVLPGTARPGTSRNVAGPAAFPTDGTPPAAEALATAPVAPTPSVSLSPASAAVPDLAPATLLNAPVADSLQASPIAQPAVAPTIAAPAVQSSSTVPVPVPAEPIALAAPAPVPPPAPSTATTPPPATPSSVAPLVAQVAGAPAPPRASAATMAAERPERRPSAGDQVSDLAQPGEAPLATGPTRVVEAVSPDPNGDPSDRHRDRAADGPAPPPIATSASSFGQLLPTGSDELSLPPLERSSAAPASSETMPRGQAYPAEPATPVVQVSTAITKAANGAVERVHVALEPRELGSIDITISVNGADETRAVIRVEKQETLELLQRDQRHLERLIGNAGLKLESGGLELGLQRDKGQGSAFAQLSPRHGRHAFDLQGVETVKGEAPVRPKPGLKLLDVLI